MPVYRPYSLISETSVHIFCPVLYFKVYSFLTSVVFKLEKYVDAIYELFVIVPFQTDGNICPTEVILLFVLKSHLSTQQKRNSFQNILKIFKKILSSIGDP